MADTAPDRFLCATHRRFRGLGPEDGAGGFSPFTFVLMADTQLGMEAAFDKTVVDWTKEVGLMQLAIQEVNRLQPAFCIVVGDLVNEYPSRSETGETAELGAMQEADFKEAMSRIDAKIPLVCLCGNHDIGNRPDAATIQRYVEHFGDDYLSFWCHGVKCLVLNSQLWKDDAEASELRKAMDDWLDKELLDTPAGTRLLVFSHIPPFIFREDEPDGYFNLDRALREALLEKLAAKGAVAWFAGHYHRNAGGVFRDAQGRSLEVVVTASVCTQIRDNPAGDPLNLSGIGGHEIGEEVSGLRVVHVTADSVQHQWRTLADLREEAEASTGGMGMGGATTAPASPSKKAKTEDKEREAALTACGDGGSG